VDYQSVTSIWWQYIKLRGRWCDIIVLNVHAPTECNSDDTEHSFYEELELTFIQFPKYHMKVLLGYFDVKVKREILSNQQTGTRVYIN
jgi:hypothetical protein